MFRFLNKLAGSLVRGTLLLPVAVLAGALTSLLFVDKLMKGQVLKAIFELLTIPFKVPVYLLAFVYETFKGGWKMGLTGLLGSAFGRLSHLVVREPFMDSSKFLAVTPHGYGLLRKLNGGFFGAIVRRLVVFLTPREDFQVYEKPELSVLAERSTNGIEAMIKAGIGKKLQSEFEYVQSKTVSAFNGRIQQLPADVRAQIDEINAQKVREGHLCASRYYGRFLVEKVSPNNALNRKFIDECAKQATRDWTPAATGPA